MIAYILAAAVVVVERGLGMGTGVEGGGKQWMKLSVGLGGPTRGESMATTRSEASERSSRRRSRSSDRGRDTGGGFYGFTRAQLEELSLQLLIFNKYLASAQTALPPPPFQLLLPIFTSFPSSFHHSSFHLLLLYFPLFALQQQQQPPSPPCLHQRERMDQPGRCRRTDGKRWRCTKEVVPNEKYCEKHMHRGCGRSRKLVESSMEKPFSSSHPSNALNLNSVDSACSHLNTANAPRDIKQEMQSCVDAAGSNSNKTIKDNGGKDQKIEDPKERRGNDGVIKIAFKLASSAFTSGKMETTEKKHKLGKDNGCVYERVKVEKIIAEKNLLSAGKDDKCSNGKVKAERPETEASNNKSKKSDAVTIEFSPKSVLHEGHSLPTANQNKTHSVVGDDLEHMRCRRTDGKRWRCRKEVIAEDQKYCAKHMHRGAKKRPVGFQGAECGEKANPFALVKRANKLVVGFDSNLKIMN